MQKCFEISMRTTSSKGKRAICNFVNEVCGTDVGDVSVADDQCECLIGAILVCLYFYYSSTFYVILPFYIMILFWLVFVWIVCRIISGPYVLLYRLPYITWLEWG